MERIGRLPLWRILFAAIAAWLCGCGSVYAVGVNAMGTPPSLTSPSSSPVSGSTTFAWNPGSGSSDFELRVGIGGPGSYDIYSSGGVPSSVTSETVNIPANGVKLYVRLYYLMGTTWDYIDYTFTEGGTLTPPSLTSPSASPVSGSTKFAWSPGGGSSEFELRMGIDGVGAYDLYNSGVLANTVTSETVTIPADGVKLYVRLYYMVNGAWNYKDYTFTEGGSPTPPTLTKPTTSPLSGSTLFTWSPGAGSAFFELRIGIGGPGAYDIYDSGEAANTVTSETVTIPANGVKLYVRLYYLVSGAWSYKDYTFTEGGSPTAPALTKPTASPLAGSTQFTWSPGGGSAFFELRIGIGGPGAYDIYNSGEAANTVTSETVSIPSNGATLYVRLYYMLNGVWDYKDYTFTEAGSVDHVTYHFDNARTGLNPLEAVLNSTSVTSTKFGLLRILPGDGLVDGQPLYLSSLTISGKQHNVVYEVTEHDSVYAYDADTGQQIWQKSVLGANETTSDDHGCGQITPEIGITSTPVIDRHAGPNGTIFVVGMSLDSSGNYHQRLHALDITSGAEMAGSPTEINATYPGTGANSSNGNVIFDPSQYAERAGLLLMNGTIYLGFTSHCDDDPYTGWLMAYSESTLKQTSVLNLTPNGSEGSIWMAGSGLAADTSGNIYFLDANGTFDTTLNTKGFPMQGDYGNGFIKVSTSGGSLTVADYFEPYDTVSLSDNDSDLGSGGVIVLPDMTDASGKTRQLAVGAGKDQNIYLVDRNSMGKFNPNDNSGIYQEVDGQIGGVWSMPAYFNNTIYYGAVSDNIKAFPFTKAMLALSPPVQTANSFTYPGTTPSISANGTSNGIVWAVENTSPAVLHAFDAITLKELYNSNQAANGRDQFGDGNKFITPAIVNGKVLVGTPSGVAEFGLLQ